MDPMGEVLPGPVPAAFLQGVDEAYEREQAELQAERISEELMMARHAQAASNGNSIRARELMAEISRTRARRTYRDTQSRLQVLQSAMVASLNTSLGVLQLEMELRASLAHYTAELSRVNQVATQQSMDAEAGAEVYRMSRERYRDLADMSQSLSDRVADRASSIVQLQTDYEEKLAGATALEAEFQSSDVEHSRQMRDLVARGEVVLQQLAALRKTEIDPTQQAIEERTQILKETVSEGTLVTRDTDVELSSLYGLLDELTAEAELLTNEVKSVEDQSAAISATAQAARMDYRRSYASAMAARQLIYEEAERLRSDVASLQMVQPMLYDAANMLDMVRLDQEAREVNVQALTAQHDVVEASIIQSTSVLRTLRDSTGSVGDAQFDISSEADDCFVAMAGTLRDIYAEGSADLIGAIDKLAAARREHENTIQALRVRNAQAAVNMERALSTLNAGLSIDYGVPEDELRRRENPVSGGSVSSGAAQVDGLAQLADAAMMASRIGVDTPVARALLIAKADAEAGAQQIADGGITDDAIEELKAERAARAAALFRNEQLSAADMNPEGEEE